MAQNCSRPHILSPASMHEALPWSVSMRVKKIVLNSQFTLIIDHNLTYIFRNVKLVQNFKIMAKNIFKKFIFMHFWNFYQQKQGRQ